MEWLFVLIVLVALISVACFSLRSKDTSKGSFIPNPQNDKVILVKGWTEPEIQKITRDFIETYKNDGYPPYLIEHHELGANLYRLTFPQDIHPRLFSFLVNLLAYPFDLDLTDRTIVVAGKATLNAGFEGTEPSLVGSKAIFYIPENDEEKDVVYVQTESKGTFMNSFRWLKWTKTDDARMPIEVINLVKE